MRDRPNILLIFPDQHRADTAGYAGHPAVRTPNINRLASEGVVFDHCYSNSPLCMPARASLMTGQYVNVHGLWNNESKIDRFGSSHVRNIRDAGYYTAQIGKAHLYRHLGKDHSENHRQEMRDWGFEEPHELGGATAAINSESEYTEYLNKKGLLSIYREHLRIYLRGLIRGYLRPWETPPCPLPAEDNIDSYTANRSVEWLRNYSDNRPFYLQVLFPGPHNPFDSPAEYRAMYRPENMPLAILDGPAGPVSPLVEAELKESQLDNMTDCHNRVMSTYYCGKVSLIDEGIGRILKTLEEKNWLNNTWIIYSSDHGEMLGDHRLNSKGVFYESAIHIPCIIRPPGGVKGWTSTGLADLLDICATLIDIAGANPLTLSAGCSLVSRVLNGPDSPEKESGKKAIFSELYGYSMVLTNRYKMTVQARTRKPIDLYDVINDPKELHNLVNDPSLKNVQQQLIDEHINTLLLNMNEGKLKLAEELELGAKPGLANMLGNT